MIPISQPTQGHAGCERLLLETLIAVKGLGMESNRGGID